MKKELSMEMRMVLAFVLMGLVIVVSQYFMKPAPAPTATKEGAEKSARPLNPAAVEKPPQPASAPPKTAQMPGQIHADQETVFGVDTDAYRVVLSNRGAVVRSWVLKDYKDRDGKPLELVNQVALPKVPAPFALAFKNQAPATDPNTALFKADPSADGLRVSFEFSD